MAIVKMKKLRLMVLRSNKDALLRELVRLGCVEFSEPNLPEDAALQRESSAIMSLKSRYSAANTAVSLLAKYVPAKSSLLSAKPEVDEDLLLDNSHVESVLEIASQIIEADDRIKHLSAEESRQRSVIESLKPWDSLDMPLETVDTKRCAVLMGSVSAKIAIADVECELLGVTDEAELFTVSSDKAQHYILVLCMKEEQAAVQDCLRSFGFTASALSGMKGTARECIAEAEKTIKELATEKAMCLEEIKELSGKREALKLCADRLSTQIALAEAEDKLYGSSSVLVMEGWMPEENEAALAEVFDKYDCAWDSSEPEEDEYPKVPVKLKNNAFTNSLNMVTNMYSLPAYGSVDANPLMAPFFILFYGLMMADIGYGLIMIAAALVALKKIKPREGTLAFCQLLLYGGISTLLMGALTGGFFGDAPYQIVHMINPNSTWEGLPYLFSPVKDSNLVLYGAMALGFIHLNTGMVINFFRKKKAGDLAGAIWEEGAMWILFVGAALAIFKIGNVAGIPVVLIVGAVMLLFGAGRNAKGIGKLTAAFSCIYNTATGWFGDILSYSRIMALMLAGGVVAQVFNSIAVMPAQGMGVNVISIICFVVIFLIGHALNFALNLLGCFVHDLRLQCLEFFGKFYSDGGKPFNPLRIKTKFVNPKEG